MCQGCADAVKKYFPDCPKKEYGDFLMSATAFPMGDAAYNEKLLKEAKEAGCKTWKDAICYADKQMDEYMKSIVSIA